MNCGRTLGAPFSQGTGPESMIEFCTYYLVLPQGLLEQQSCRLIRPIAEKDLFLKEPCCTPDRLVGELCEAEEGIPASEFRSEMGIVE